MYPEILIPLGVVGLLVVKLLCWIFITPPEDKRSREEWWMNYHAERAKFDEACNEFETKVDEKYPTTRSERWTKSTRQQGARRHE